MSDIRIRAKHLRTQGFCLVPGARDWCAMHGIDFRRLVKEGIPIGEVEQIDDLFCRRAIEQAKKDAT